MSRKIFIKGRRSCLKQGRKRKGFTLVEVMFSAGILVFVILSFMRGFIYFVAAGESAENKVKAIVEAQNKIEEIRNASFDDVKDKKYERLNANYDPAGYIVEEDDIACQGFIDGDGKCDGYGSFVFVGGTGSGFIYIDNTDPELLEIEVVMSWVSKKGIPIPNVVVEADKQKYRRVVGEDQNLNGVLDAGEDVNGNGKIDSSIVLKTLLTNKKR